MLKREEQSQHKRVIFDDEANKKIKKAHEKLMKDLAELEKKNAEHSLNERDKEEKAVFDKYDKLLKQVRKGSHEEIVIRTAMANDIEDIDKKYTERALKEKEKYYKDRQKAQYSAEVIELDEVIEFYDGLIKQAQAYGEEWVTLERDKEIKMAEIRDKYNPKAEAVKSNAKDQDLNYLHDRFMAYKNYLDDVNTITSEFNKREDLRREAQLKASEKQYNEDTEREKRLVDNKVISKKEYDVRVAKLDAEKKEREARLHKESAIQERRAASFSAFLNGLEAVSKTLAKYGLTPQGIFLAAGMAAKSLVTIDTINSAPIPEYAEGGYTQNGPGLYTSSTGKNFIAGEAGQEYIVPNWMLQNPMVANQVGMMEAIRTGRMFAQGGSTAVSQSITPVSNTSNSADLIATLQALTSILQDGVYAKLVYDDFKKDLTSIDNARRSSAITS
jgi:hypothetical protein